MRQYNITDEVIINTRPDIVYKAIIDEMNGKTHWWKPYRTTKLLEGKSYDRVGAHVEHTVYVLGKIPIKFITKTIKVKTNKTIEVNYVKGSFSGTGLWIIEPFENKTKLSYRWQTRPSSLVLRILAPFLPIAKSHSISISVGCANLNEFLEQKSYD